MSKRAKALSLIAALAALPGAAAAADLYGYGEEAPAYRGRPHPEFDGGYRGDDVGPARRRGPGPVVFDERGGRYGDEFGFGPPPGPAYAPRPAYRPRPVYGAFGPPRGFGPGDGEDLRPAPFDRPAPFYRPAAVAVAPGYGAGFGGPEAGCTEEQARSVTPAGWRKTVTHRTCYSR